MNNHMRLLNIGAADDKNTQTDVVNTADIGTQTQILGLYSTQPSADPYDLMFRPYANLPYLPPRMPLPANLPHGPATYNFSQWPYNALPHSYKDPYTYNSAASADLSEFGGLVNGLTDQNSFDPLENFCPHDTDEPVAIPLEKNGNDVAIENETSLNVSSEYALFPTNSEPLCSPKTSHMNLVSEKDDVVISRLLQAEQEREQKSYATALKDHKEGQQSLPNSYDQLPSPSGARSRSSSTASGNNLSRSASSSDFHPLSPTRETHDISIKSPSHRPYVGVDDIDPQQKANLLKMNNVSNMSNPTFSDFFDNLHDSPEYLEATKEKHVKAGWRPHSGRHEKTGRRLEFKPQYIDKEGRMRHGIRVRGALKSMECWLHTNSKPPVDCLFAHSRIGDTLEFICMRCTYEKPRNYECRDKKTHVAYFCNLGPYRDINGEKWRDKGEASQ